jgi:hypothetical protein
VGEDSATGAGADDDEVGAVVDGAGVVAEFVEPLDVVVVASVSADAVLAEVGGRA